MMKKLEKLNEQTLKAQKCSNLSDKIDTYFTEPFAMLFSRLFLKMNLHPNTVTLFSIITGVIGGVFFIFHNIWLNIIGIILEILAAVFDASDGQVARLSGKKSEFGRFFDGVGDTIVYSAIYLGTGIHIMLDKIPFPTFYSGYWIWFFAVIIGIFLHPKQARIADYLRNLHMYLGNNKRGNELSRAKKYKANSENKDNTFLHKLMFKSFYTYTKAQEKATPKTQRLLNAIEDGGVGVLENLSQDFLQTSNKIIKRTNLLTFNLRTYTLFALIIISGIIGYDFIPLIYLFVILVLEPIRISLTRKYERLLEKLYDKYYKG